MEMLGRTEPMSRGALADAFQEFLWERKARGLSPYTIRWYRQQLERLCADLSDQDIASVEEVSPAVLRGFLHNFAQNHNAGGTHGAYRAMHAFFSWWSEEYELPNPMAKVIAPKVPEQILEPVDPDHLKAMLTTCARRTLYGDRDRAILLALLDTGCRKAEFLALDVGDVALATGTMLIRHGKGGKARATFIGVRTRQALLAYLRHRRGTDAGEPLWIDREGKRLSNRSLRALLARRAKQAGVPTPSPHMFRRAFAIGMLRDGADLVTLQRLLGHSSLAVVSRYLKQVDADLQAAHAAHSPADKLLAR